jgi:hypothetical protein
MTVHGVDDLRLQRWMAWLDARIDDEARAMSQGLGDSTTCRVHKDGRVTGGLKYTEGRLAAFAEARRLGRDSHHLEDSLAAFVLTWREELERRTNETPTSMPWVAYATGGAEAAELAVAAFDEPGGDRTG